MMRLILRARPFKALEAAPERAKYIFAQTLKGIAYIWTQRYLPKHFTREAYSRYGYVQRDPSYEAWKKQVYGATDPLVMRGELKATVLGNPSNLQVVHGADRFYVRVPLPIPHPLTPQSVKELQAINQQEVKELTVEAKSIAIGMLKELGLKTWA